MLSDMRTVVLHRGSHSGTPVTVAQKQGRGRGCGLAEGKFYRAMLMLRCTSLHIIHLRAFNIIEIMPRMYGINGLRALPRH